MMRGLVLIATLVCGLMSPMFTSAGAMERACDAPDDVAGVVTPLARVGASLKPRATLHILAIGSASLFGPEASLLPGSLTSQALSGATTTVLPPAQVLPISPSDSSFPAQMARSLERAIPDLKVDVKAHGGRGLSAADQLRLLDEGLHERKFELVIWQTGTVEAVRNLPPSEFAQTLADGAALADRAGADLVLIDPQFSRFLQTNSNIEPYQQALQQISSFPGVLLFHRFDLMRSWVNDGQIDLERTSKTDRKKAVELLHACLGAHLAKVILSASRL